MASRTKLLTELTLTDLWREVKDPATLWGDLPPKALRTLTLLLQNRMYDELTHYLSADRYAHVHGRRGYSNGTYIRALTTTWGTTRPMICFTNDASCDRIIYAVPALPE